MPLPWAPDRPGNLTYRNFNRHTLPTIYAKLPQALGGTALANISAMGDSITVGATSTNRATKSYAAQLMTLFIAGGYPDAGDGYISLGVHSGLPDPRVTNGSPGMTQGSLYATSSTAGQSIAVTSLRAATKVDLNYLRTAGLGTINVNIDGVDQGNFSTAGATSFGISHPYPGQASSTHTVTITIVTGAGGNTINAVGFVNAAGVAVSEYGINGGDAATIQAFQARYVGAPVSDLAIFLAETNDANLLTSLASYRTTMRAFITTARAAGSDVLLMTSPRPQTAGQAVNFPTYDAVLYGLSDALAVPLIDVGRDFGTWAQANAKGYMGDGLHPNDAGYLQIATLIYNGLIAL